jgi:hypothetical protein
MKKIFFIFLIPFLLFPNSKNNLGTWSAGPAGGFIFKQKGIFIGEGILDQVSGTYTIQGNKITLKVLKGYKSLNKTKIILRKYSFDPKKDQNILDENEKEMEIWKQASFYLKDEEGTKYFK